MDSFCVLPFIQFNNELRGEAKPCCINDASFGNTREQAILESWNCDAWRALRRALLAGERHPSCRRCWEQEALGVESFREMTNRIQGNLLDLRPASYDASSGRMSQPPRMLVLKHSSSCNLACRMCFPAVSSSVNRVWDADLAAITGQVRQRLAPNYPDRGRLGEELRTIGPRLHQISFGGGEPLSDPAVLRTLLELRPWAHQIQAHANTNLSRLRSVSSATLAAMTGFRSCILTVSVDGPPALHGYIRPGLDIEAFLENLERVRRLPNTQIDTNTAVQALNVAALPATLDFLLEVVRPESLLVSLATGSGVEYLDARTLPRELKLRIVEQLSRFGRTLDTQRYPRASPRSLANARSVVEQVSRFCLTKDLDTPEHWARLSSYYRKLDRVHGTDLAAVCPDLAARLSSDTAP